MIWTPTGLTTVTGNVSRRIQDTADEATVGVTTTTIGLRVDHELRRNVLLRASANAFLDDYSRGQGSQTLATAGAGADYQLNRNIRLSAGYDFAARTSGGSNANLGTSTISSAAGNFGTSGTAGSLGSGSQQFGSSYTDHRIMLRVRFQL